MGKHSCVHKGKLQTEFPNSAKYLGVPPRYERKKIPAKKQKNPTPDDRVKKGRKTPTTNQGSEFRCSVVPFVVLVPPRSRHSVPPLSGSTPVRLEEIRDTRIQGGPLPVINEAPWGPGKNAEHKCVIGVISPNSWGLCHPIKKPGSGAHLFRTPLFFSATKIHFEELFVDLFERVDLEKPKMDRKRSKKRMICFVKKHLPS